MTKYRVTAVIDASVDIGEFEAASAEEAEEMASDIDKCYVSICHQCSGQLEVGDVVQFIVEPVEAE